MADLGRGLYETLITESLQAQLEGLDESHQALKSGMRPPEVADRIALHLSRIIHRAISLVREKDRAETGIRLAQRLVEQIDELSSGGTADLDRPIDPGTVLRAVARTMPDGTPEKILEPLIPLLDTTLLTNAPGEPRVGHQIGDEIPSADRVDVVMAFIRWSGIRPLLDVLKRHRDEGRTLRVLTTTYTGSTEARALDALESVGASIKVSYDTSSTRLHAKAWLFHRGSGFSTAYIGSSNLSHSAQVAGLEWNVRVSGARNPAVLEKVEAVFNSYWDGADFVPYDRSEFLERSRAAQSKGPRVLLSPTELRPEPFQERLLEQIELSRQQGHHRNLIAAATGTGKTVMAAIDYCRLRQRLPRARLLFVAHRKEILEQSLATFRQALRDQAFGELWVGGQHPVRFEHVFASIQSLHAKGLHDLEPDRFDVVIIDEFHHAAAQSYEALLDRLTPIEFLGLTATPERSDGLPVLQWFGDRIAAELRLWDAVDQHRLAPFEYYGIHDGLDLREVPWRRGRGYDVEGLTNVLTANDAWTHLVLARVVERVGAVDQMRALGFCVSIEHARFMARKFNEAGIRASAIWADSSDDERQAALKDLEARRINILFSVDLFNEGIDLPTVDTLLLLRPTDSPTLFLQQLGRGLRLSHGKTTCLVLDFVGHHRKEFRMDRRYRALLGGSRQELCRQIESGFPFLPAGCHLELDPVAAEAVLRNIRESVPTRWTARVEELRLLASGGKDVSLSQYLEGTGLELEEIYSGAKTWSDLREAAGLAVHPRGPQEKVLRRACGRLLHVDDSLRLEGWRRFLESTTPPSLSKMTEAERRLLRMLVGSVTDRALAPSATLEDATALLWSHPQVCAELLDLLTARVSGINHLQAVMLDHPDVPLRVHARYSRIEILSAFGTGHGAKTPSWREGVYWAEEAGVDILAFTLDKTSGAFSPTTRYNDYAINPGLIHWESQSNTRADSPTGRRYRNLDGTESTPMLFCRLRSDDRAFFFLGPATFVSHEGERPMAIKWRLRHPLPGDLFMSFAAAVA